MFVKDQAMIGARFGQTLRDSRTRAGLSQAAVAERMVRSGFGAWRQSTVAKTEAGERPLLAVEMFGLIDMLGLDVHSVIEAVAYDDDLARQIVEAESDLMVAQQQLAAAERQLEQARTDFRCALGHLEGLQQLVEQERGDLELAPLDDTGRGDQVDDIARNL